MALEFKKAVRKAAPMLISISSVSGGGKTYSALLMAAGLAGAGRVGFLDTENGRGAMYADSPGIVAALPSGFDILQMDAPFSPKRYIEHIEAAEKAGLAVLVIDSTTHEWEGIGGCTEIAEKNKLRNMDNWGLAKKHHKLFMYHCLSSQMHILFCLRARDKVRIEGGTVTPIGLQAVCEKNFQFEMLVSLQLDEKTHHATPLKCPEPLRHLFTGNKLIAKSDGESIRKWNEGGVALADGEQLGKRARAIAEDGADAYKAFWTALSPAQKKLIPTATHEENKRIAVAADEEASAALPLVEEEADPMEFGPDAIVRRADGSTWRPNAEQSAWTLVSPAKASAAA